MVLLGGRESDVKQVAVVTRNQKFARILCSILADWKFFAVDDLSAAKVVFAERGVHLPAHVSKVVWLTPMPLVAGTFLQTPICLTELYQLLEGQYFPNPRRNIRISLALEVDLQIEGAWLTGRMISLSDRGGRIQCAAEIPKGRRVHLEVNLAGRLLKLDAEVLYCVPGGDSPGTSQPQTGVLFKPASDREFNLIRHFIETTCIEQACAREGIALKDPCVSWFDEPTDPWSTTCR